MNNKLFKLAVVLVTIVVVLCSFASAATINSLSCTEAKDKIEMNVIFADDATRGAYIAYAAQKVDAGTVGAEVVGEESFVLGPIVAIFQADTEQYLKLGNHGESINPELIPEECGHIVLKAGDNGVDSTVAASLAAEIPVAVTKYNIKFVNYDGTELKTIEVAEGDTPVYDGETPVKAADAKYTYAFAGWDKDLVAATEDATYTATFTETAIEYTVLFYDEDGVTVLDEQKLNYGATPVYAGVEPTKAADENFTYEFAGWNPAIAEVTGDATYTATYEATPIVPDVETFTVTFVSEGATVATVEEVAAGTALSTLVPAEPTKAKNTFIGWYLDEAFATKMADNTVVADTTLYAKFSFTGIYGDANGDGSIKPTDTVQLKKYLKNKNTYEGYAGSAIADCVTEKGAVGLFGDANGDGSIKPTDTVQLKKYLKNKNTYEGYCGDTMVMVKD